MTRLASILTAATLLSFAFTSTSAGAAPDDGANLLTRVYPVADLLVSTPDHPYPGDELPTTEAGAGRSSFAMGGMGGVMGGGMGGGMGMGGQKPKVDPEDRNTQREAAERASMPQDITGLIETLYATVDPVSWDHVGGEASCVGFGGSLVVRQTMANHELVAELLDAMRSEGGAAGTLVIQAYWLMLASDELDALVGPAGSPSDVDPAGLEAMVRGTPSFRGQISCFSGQTVHLAAGSRRAVVSGAIPVVGSLPAYQPVMANPNIGVLLEVTPSLLSAADAVVLDLASTVTGWREPDAPVQIGGVYPPENKAGLGVVAGQSAGGFASITVDRVHMPTQQLATTVRVPLGKPVLVGGLTLDPTESDDDARERKQLYLIVRASAGNGE